MTARTPSLVAWACLASGMGCSSSSSSKTMDVQTAQVLTPGGQDCSSDSDCVDHVCAHASENGVGLCTRACSSDADCSSDPPGGTCTKDVSGRRVCVTSCTGTATEPGPDQWVCVNGTPVVCSLAPRPTCGCGCAAGEFCQAGVGCTKLAATGEPCKDNTWCTTGACVMPPSPGQMGSCSVPSGSPCFPDNCQVCLMPTNGPISFCTTDCSQQPCDDSAACRMDGETGLSGCYPLCAAGESCPQGFTCTVGLASTIGTDEVKFCTP